jgi:hypothetical protein
MRTSRTPAMSGMLTWAMPLRLALVWLKGAI